MTLPATYCTVGDVLTNYPPIGSATTITSAQIAEAIGAVQARVDGKLARRYAVPFSPAPPLIQAITCDLSVYRLHRRLFTQQSQNKSDWPDRWKETEDQLCGLADGTILLTTGSGTVIEATGETMQPWSSTAGLAPTMTEGRWEDMQVDPRKVES